MVLTEGASIQSSISILPNSAWHEDDTSAFHKLDGFKPNAVHFVASCTAVKVQAPKHLNSFRA